MLNVEPRNLVFLKTYKAEFDEIMTTFTDQNGRFLEMIDYSIEPVTAKNVKGYGFLLFARNFSDKYGKQ